MGAAPSTARKRLLQPEKVEQMRELFNKFDKDHNGTLDRDEWLQVTKIVWEEREQFGLAEIAEDNDDSTIEYFSKSMFDKADANKDGLISFQEFIDFFQGLKTNSSVYAQPSQGEEKVIAFEITYNYVMPKAEWRYCCAICFQPAVYPVILADNSSDNIFCKTCILNEMGLSDNQGAPIVNASEECWAFLESMKVRCCFEFNGCQEINERSQISKHLFECPFKKYLCPNSSLGCAMNSVEINDVGVHLANCPYSSKLQTEEVKFHQEKAAALQPVFHSVCKTCHTEHDAFTTSYYHTGSFHGMSWENFIEQRDAHKLHGKGASDTFSFCGRVALKSLKCFGKDTWVCTKASAKAGAISFIPVTYVSAIVLCVATSPAGGAGVLVAPLIGGAVTATIAIGGTCGGLLIGAGHAIATPFIDFGKVTRSAINKNYNPKTGCLPKWNCCRAEGSWAQGCRTCSQGI